jgi:hypothetical protein
MAHSEEEKIIDLERKFWITIREKDVEGSIAMLAERSVAGAQGVALLTHDDYRGMARQDDSVWQLLSFEFSDLKVIFPSRDVAVVAYIVTEEMEVDAKRLTMKAADTTTRIRKNDRWLAAVHTESVVGDPFGRDRN